MVAEAFVEESCPDIILLVVILVLPPIARKLGYEFRRFQESILTHTQLGHRRCKGVPPWSQARNVVPVLLQAAEQVWFPRFDQILEATVPGHVRVGAREHAAAGLRADRGLGEAVGEERPSPAEGIDVGRADDAA